MPRPPKNTAALPVMFIGKGAALVLGDREYVVLHLLGLNKVLARDVASGWMPTAHPSFCRHCCPPTPPVGGGKAGCVKKFD